MSSSVVGGRGDYFAHLWVILCFWQKFFITWLLNSPPLSEWSFRGNQRGKTVFQVCLQFQWFALTSMHEAMKTSCSGSRRATAVGDSLHNYMASSEDQLSLFVHG